MNSPGWGGDTRKSLNEALKRNCEQRSVVYGSLKGDLSVLIVAIKGFTPRGVHNGLRGVIIELMIGRSIGCLRKFIKVKVKVGYDIYKIF